MERIGFFHHGSLPNQDDVDALKGRKVHGRNAVYFRASELENFDKVVVDKGPNTDAIKKAYGNKVVSIESLSAEPKKAEPKKAEVDLDKQVQKPEPKPQGK